MLDNLKNLFEDFDFRLPTSLDDITADFVAVVVCVVALAAIVISVCVLSKKKKEHIAEMSERREAESNERPRETKPMQSKFIPEEKNLGIKQRLAASPDKQQMPAVGKEVSYAADFEPKNTNAPTPVQRPKPASVSFAAKPVEPRAEHHAESAPEAKKKDVVHVEDGFVIITAAQKAKLENAYSIAVRKCAVNGTSEDLERLLDAKRMLSKTKIPQREFKALLTLLFPKDNG